MPFKKKILILFCLIALIFSMACVSAADDANQTTDDVLSVSFIGQDIQGSADGGTFAELQNKINAAEEGSTINLENDYVSDDNLLRLNKSITINGNGHTLNARGYGILDIESDNVILKNITFINGDYYGSAISICGNNTIISDCHFKDNGISFVDSYLEGGALFINGNNTLISNCYFENNGFSGLNNLYGGAISIHGNGTRISDSFFKGNEIYGEYGPAEGGDFYCDCNLTVVNSTFISNMISCYDSLGGAIYSTGSAYIFDSVFTDNSLYGVSVHGGAIHADSVYVNNSAFECNSIFGSRIWESSYTSSSGGAISSESAYVFNSNFTNNSASSNDKCQPSRGGAVYSSGILNIGNSNFENNSADKGEALWAYQVYSHIGNSTFINNDYALVKAYIEAQSLVKHYGGSERFRVYLTEDGKARANANVNININGKDYVRTTDEDGMASMAINLNPGEYDATVTYEDAIANSTITVMSTVDGENITKIFRNATQYYATFFNSEGYRLIDTEVEFNINGLFYKRLTNEEGVAKLNINLNPGKYIITAKNPISGELYSNFVTVLPNMVENSDLTKYYKNDSQYVVKVLDDEGNPAGAGENVTFNINGVFYTRTTNETGHAKLNINLNPGEYIITAMYKGLMVSNMIKVLSVIEAKDLVMRYKDGSKFEASILDGQGNPYPGQNVTFNINGVFYIRITDDSGIARLNINLMVGEYIITSSCNELSVSNKITISS